jgi:hypothetical protein
LLLIHEKNYINILNLLALLYLLKDVNKILIWGYGEIGKHAGLKNQCRKASRFDSGYPYQTSHLKVDNDFGRLFVIFNSTNNLKI